MRERGRESICVKEREREKPTMFSYTHPYIFTLVLAYGNVTVKHRFRTVTEIKQRRAWSVSRWVTSCEYQVL